MRRALLLALALGAVVGAPRRSAGQAAIDQAAAERARISAQQASCLDICKWALGTQRALTEDRYGQADVSAEQARAIEASAKAEARACIARCEEATRSALASRRDGYAVGCASAR